MIKVKFYHSKEGAPSGFMIKGHAGHGTHGNDIVCSAVSSAAYMTANTIIEVLGINPSVDIHDGVMEIILPEESAEKGKDILLGFELHIKGLSEQYPKNVTITTTEV